MLTEALTYIRRTENPTRTVLIGTLLTMLGFLIVPLFMVLGFAVRVVRAAQTDDEPPVWEDWKELTVDGVKMFAIALAYTLIPILLLLVGIGTASITIDPETGAATFQSFTALSIATLTLSAVISLAVAYVLPIGIAHFAETGRIGDAFKFGQFKSAATNSTYAIAWLLAVAVNIVGGAVLGAVAIVPLLGFFLAAALAFYLNVVTWYIYGRGIGLSEGLPQRPEPEDISGPAV
ncbi:DUF4013 domain-containing protein [Haloarchaeobius sp. DYHT-AS-18]|uniref:DUF4013 domain-containing protein n=1 Tax=Haloarchaeobius sp. DYHT-AS-18 TaxID=3446117 RepID=UPI003EBF8D00